MLQHVDRVKLRTAAQAAAGAQAGRAAGLLAAAATDIAAAHTPALVLDVSGFPGHALAALLGLAPTGHSWTELTLVVGSQREAAQYNATMSECR